MLDSHVLLWAIDQPELLSKKARAALLNESNELYVSVGSIWEISLKVQSGKLKLPAHPDYLESNLRQLGVHGYLAIALFHVYQLAKLPLIHKDPFDRLLVSQAIVEGLTLVTKDKVIGEYPVAVLW